MTTTERTETSTQSTPAKGRTKAALGDTSKTAEPLETPPQEEQHKKAFDPQERLIKVKGGQLYLEVRWRLVWFREEHPDASIEVELTHLDLDSKLAVARATITLPNGTTATEIGSETEKDFPAGWIEKAATKSVGRALAALGFGTQFALELDEGQALADSPVPPPAERTTGTFTQRAGNALASRGESTPAKGAEMGATARAFLAEINSSTTKAELGDSKSGLVARIRNATTALSDAERTALFNAINQQMQRVTG